MSLSLRVGQKLRICFDCAYLTREQIASCKTCNGEGDIVVTPSAAAVIDSGAWDDHELVRCQACEAFELLPQRGLCGQCEAALPKAADSEASRIVAGLERSVNKQRTVLAETEQLLSWAKDRAAEFEQLKQKAGG